MHLNRQGKAAAIILHDQLFTEFYFFKWLIKEDIR